MIIIPIYSYRNCKKIYPSTKLVIADTYKLLSAAWYTLGSQDHVFRIAGKTIQLSDLLIKIQITKEEREEEKQKKK